MYRYKIGYTSYEESSFVELEHEQKFSHQELSELIAEATVETFKKLRGKSNIYIHNFQDVFHDIYNTQYNIVSYLIENKGFKRIEYQDVWSVFGWASIFDRQDWGSDRDPELDFIVNKMNEAGFDAKDDSHLNWLNGEKDENKSE